MGVLTSIEFTVACPKCSAAARQRCRTVTTGRVTDTHVARMLAAWAAHPHTLPRAPRPPEEKP
jgi:hypothetical protein